MEPALDPDPALRRTLLIDAQIDAAVDAAAVPRLDSARLESMQPVT